MIISSSTASAETAQEIPAGRWLAAMLVSILLLLAINVLIAWRMDVFGVFRDPHGRALRTFDEHQRMVKYMLNGRYVPANFDALIIGASASVNWHPEDLTGYRFYNESLEGSNAAEQRKLVEQALPRGHFRVALVLLYPHITASHYLNEGLDDVNRREALGSINLFDTEWRTLRDRLRHRQENSFPNGSHVLDNVPRPAPGAYLKKFESADEQDPQSIEDYRALVQELMDRGTRIIYVTYPLWEPHYDGNKALVASYMASMARTMPAAPVIDFNAPEYKAFRSDPGNFLDNVHLSEAGATQLSEMLNTRMHQALGN